VPEASLRDAVARFEEAQKGFIQVAGIAAFDPKANSHG